ncbi:hypothetical protein Acsp02_87770 [Actinoplanes sp. NBRC 103695]|nr:hypothetical protein Acsp02_87770 [Actinoplanes sp. NBRC 103695]
MGKQSKALWVSRAKRRPADPRTDAMVVDPHDSGGAARDLDRECRADLPLRRGSATTARICHYGADLPLRPPTYA